MCKKYLDSLKLYVVKNDASDKSNFEFVASVVQNSDSNMYDQRNDYIGQFFNKYFAGFENLSTRNVLF